jgi:hypothetical protein
MSVFVSSNRANGVKKEKLTVHFTDLEFRSKSINNNYIGVCVF